MRSALATCPATLPLVLAAIALLAGCAVPQPTAAPDPAPAAATAATPMPLPVPVPAPASTPAPVPAAPAATPAPTRSVASGPSAGASALRDGISAFNQGEYKRAENKLLESQKLGLNQTSEQVLAHKNKAFLYCVTRRAALCEQAFASAFESDSAFNLSRAERGHPVWGPVFAKVQKRQPK